MACFHLLWPPANRDVWKHAILKQNYTNSCERGPGLWGIICEWRIVSCLLSSHSTVCLILLFSQYLSKVDVPMIAYKDKNVEGFPVSPLQALLCELPTLFCRLFSVLKKNIQLKFPYLWPIKLVDNYPCLASKQCILMYDTLQSIIHYHANICQSSMQNWLKQFQWRCGSLRVF